MRTALPLLLLCLWCTLSPSLLMANPPTEPLKPASVQQSISPELAAYRKRLFDRIGSRWNELMQAHAKEVPTPTKVKLELLVWPKGAITNVKVVPLRGFSPRLVILCEEAVNRTVVPPIPPAVQAGLPPPRRALVVNLTFEVL